MKIQLMALASAGFVLGACAPYPPEHIYTHRTVYYTPKTKAKAQTAPSTSKYTSGSSRTYYGSSDSAESFRATTR